MKITNTPSKCDKPRIEAAGDSDHLAIIVTKYTKELRYRPNTVLKRSYKNFDTGQFLQDIHQSELNESVIGAGDIKSTAELFKDIFGHILDKACSS